jgi:hypothetical protein
MPMTSGIESSRWSYPVLALLSTLVAPFTASCSSNPQPAGTEVLDPTQSHYGSSDGEWGARWWKWFYEIPMKSNDAGMPVCTVPSQDPTGAYCAINQSGDVFFLAGTAGGMVERDGCVVPLGKAIFFPIFNFVGDNAGLAPNMQFSDAMLMQGVTGEMAAVSVPSLSAEFDGVSIPDLGRFATQVTQFSYTLPAEPNTYTCEGETGVIGNVPTSYAAGYYIMLAPPSAGVHVLKFGGTAMMGNQTATIAVTYKLTVK